MNNNYYVKTIKSPTHESNQDRIFYKIIDDFTFVIGTFDGVSSNRFSAFASQICKEVFLNDEYDDLIDKYPTDWMNFKLNEINERFAEFIDSNHQKIGMSTTLNVNLIIRNIVINFNIGDSRTYVTNDKKIKLLSRDDNLYNWLKDNNIDPKTHKHQKFLHALTNCVEYKETNQEFKTNYYKLSPGDILICCTDGFYKFFDFRKYKFSSKMNAQKFVEEAIEIAISNQEKFNFFDDISLGVYIYESKASK